MEESCAPQQARKARRWADVAAVGLVGVLTAWTIVGRMSDPEQQKYLVLDVVVGIVSLALIPLLARRPVQGALALAALATLSPPGTPSSPLGPLSIPLPPAGTPSSTVGTLTVALRRPFRTAALVALAGVAGHLIQGAWQPIPGL